MSSNDTPRAMTVEEMRSIIIDHIRSTLRYWAKTPLTAPEFQAELQRKGETMYRMEGLVHSILVMFDGGSPGIPALNITADPNPADEAFHRDEGSNWWQSGVVLNECQLHELWYRK